MKNYRVRRNNLLVAGLLFISGLLTACSLSPDQSSSTDNGSWSTLPAENSTSEVQLNPDGSKVYTSTPRQRSGSPLGRQDLVLAGSQRGPVTLDPALVRDVESAFIVRQIFRGLTRLDQDLDIVPDLAERIEVSSDGLLYRFTLRSTAMFQGGQTLTASSVVSSFNRATDPALAGGDGWSLPAANYLNDIQGVAERLSGQADTVSGVTAIDERTLEIILVRRAESFLYKLSGSPTLIVDVGSTASNSWWRPNGSGPFEITRFEDGESLELGANSSYWEGAPYLNSVKIQFGAGAANVMNLYESGQIAVTDVPLYAIDRVLTETDYLHSQLRVQPQLSTTFVMMNPNIEPFTDRAVREAIVQALDRDRIVEVAFEGKVDLAAGLIPPGILDRTWVAQLPDYDISGAAAMLEGSREPELAQFVSSGGGILIILKETMFLDLGVDVEVIRQPWPEFSSQLVEQSMPGFSLSWVADYPDPENFLTALFYSRSPDNYIGYRNPAVDQLLDEAGSESDSARRSELYLQAQQLIIDDAVVIPIFHDVGYTLVHPSVQNLSITPVGILSLDDVWIKN